MSSSLQTETARLLLRRFPKDERPLVVRDIAKSLHIENGTSDVGFAATLLRLEPDVEASRLVTEHLRSLTEAGKLEMVVALSSEQPELSADLLRSAHVHIKLGADGLESAVPTPGYVSSTAGDEEGPHGLASKTAFYLQLANQLTRQALVANAGSHFPEQSWVLPSLRLLGSRDKALRAAAQDSLDLALLTSTGLSEQDHIDIWARVQSLLVSDDPEYRSLGASLWLRWIVASHSLPHAILQDGSYWTTLVEGMRCGDSERRKACLQILRASVDVCVMHPALRSTITARSLAIESPEDVQKQYARFCNVFETIVLGRYLNQVQQCEADLDFLISPQSMVQPVWLYTLLVCALEQKMQDSNRKFIGSWIMQSRLRTDEPDQLIEFWRTAFLPWAMSGYLFTSTLRKGPSSMYCEHGEKLATYVSRILEDQPEVSGRVVDTIIDTIHTRHANTFAYAIVFLIHGIGRAAEAGQDVSLTPTQLAKIQEIGTWLHIPEIAQDYILSQSWKLCHYYVRKHVEEEIPPQVKTGAARWSELLEKAGKLRSTSSVQEDGPISSVALSPSKRDMNERAAYDKCQSLLRDLQASEEAGQDHLKTAEQLDDVWNDLEYTEYPKGLLKSLPRVVVSRSLITAALNDKGGELAVSVAHKTRHLLQLAESRSYMLPSLVDSLRNVVLNQAGSASVLQLSDLIVQVADHPASATIDAQLEGITIPLLTSLAPALQVYDYRYYFGQRETIGFAAFLDLVSRLSAVEPKQPQQVLDTILQTWVKQKVPPSSVSSWKTVLQLQVLVLCCEQVMGRIEAEEARTILKDLHYVLAIEPLPRYRYLLEWMIARTYMHHPDLRPVIFEELRTKDHHSNPKFLASLMKIGARIARTEDADEEFALQLGTVFVPLAASSKVVIRHEAQWQVPIFLDHVRAKRWTSITDNKAFDALDEFIRSLERFSDPPQDRLIDTFDPVKDNTLTNLVEGPWHDLDSVEARLCSHADFLSLPPGPETSKTCIPLGDTLPATSSQLFTSTPAAPASKIDLTRRLLQNIDNISRALGSGPGPTTLAVQTKGTAYLTSSSTRTRHTDLLVIASLVDNPYNLGGLSRVSEIFGAGALYMPTTQVTSNKDFISVAVASHHHIPIHALLAPSLPEFLQKKKREEGFSIVGIEQTDRSVLIGQAECVLPRKCILVMGSEREGIPAEVLGMCDVLVEIPQVGVTRSLNVQTAAAIVLCEYVRQFSGKKGK